jgi:hypothetical protein
MRDGRVTAPATDAAPRVDADDVSRSQHARAGNAVHDLVVDRDAACCWKRNLPRHSLEQRDRVVLREKLIDGPIDFTGGDTRLDQRPGNLMRPPDNEAGPPHQGNFTSGTKIDHASNTHTRGDWESNDARNRFVSGIHAAEQASLTPRTEQIIPLRNLVAPLLREEMPPITAAD